MKTKKFLFCCPTRWLHGLGVTQNVGEKVKEFGAKKALIVTDKGVRECGHLDTVLESLEQDRVEFDIFDEVQPEPPSKLIDNAIETIRRKKIDIIIAIGGGSTIDVAKGFRLLSVCGGSIKDYAGINKIPRTLPLPLIAIPTTAGTGSEVSPGAVFTDEEKQSKFAVVDWKNAPTLAITDPLLTMTMPSSLTGITGIDALAHAVESFVSVNAQPVTEPLSLEAIRLIGENLEKAITNGRDLKARENMQIACTMAMIAAGNTQLGLAHAIGMPLAVNFNLPHGVAVGVMLPYVMKFNLKAQSKKFRRIAEVLSQKIDLLTDSEAGEKAVVAIKQLTKKAGIPSSLKELGVDKDSFTKLAKSTLLSHQTQFNPRRVTEEKSIVEILQDAY